MFKRIILPAILLNMFSQTVIANNLQQKAELWATLSLQGPINQNKKILYSLEPQLKFITRKESFHQAYLHAGLGYQSTPTVSLWIGNSLGTTHNPGKEDEIQYRLWQQLAWDPQEKYSLNFSSRTRLEQRVEDHQEGCSWRLRQKVTFSMPLQCSPNYAVVIFDEIFFNLNHPSWVNNNLINQNRAFFGLSIPVAKKMFLETGYLNQYLVRTPDKMMHVLSCTLKVKAD